MEIEFIERGYSKWDAFLKSGNKRIGTVSYSDTPLPELSISLGSDELRADISQGNFFDGGGSIRYNGERAGSWLAKIPVEFTISDTHGTTVMQLKIDDWNRRFKWAYRHGISAKQSWQYASWGELLIGRNFVLSSIINPGFGWQFGASSNPLNSSDELIVESLSIKEQLMVLLIVFRRLCSVYPNMTKSPSWPGLGKNCPDVPSFVKASKRDQSYMVLDPNQIRTKNALLTRIVEFLATGHPICWSLIVICIGVYILSPSSTARIGAIIFGLIPLGYLVLTWLTSSSSIKEIIDTSEASK